MGFIDEIKKKLGLVEDNKTEEIMKERSKIKVTMEENLRRIGFNDAEVNEVLDILTKCEKDVQEKKDELIGTNINNEYTGAIMSQVFKEIREIELRAAADIREKTAEIVKRKKEQQNGL